MKQARYKVNGSIYPVKSIDKTKGIVFLSVGCDSFPVSLQDVQFIEQETKRFLIEHRRGDDAGHAWVDAEDWSAASKRAQAVIDYINSKYEGTNVKPLVLNNTTPFTSLEDWTDVDIEPKSLI